MSETVEDAAESGRLSGEELRVLGCLVEKQMTTPDQYPMTLNALVLACNQKSNRDPVVHYGEDTVERAVTSSKTKGFVRFVHPSHGRSALRYGHLMLEKLGVSERQLALLAVLALRGAQTPGELRARTERMAEWSDLADLERELDRLRGLDVALVRRLGRRPGQSQDRYVQLLGGDASPEANAGPAPEPAGVGTGGDGRRIAGLEEQVIALRSELDQLRRELGELRSSLGD